MDIKKLSKQDEKIIETKKVFVRADLDVPFDSDLRIADSFRIDRCLETIKYLVDLDCAVVLATKLGRPEEKKISTKNIVDYLSKIIGKTVKFVDDYPGDRAAKAIKDLKNTEVLLLENVRFFPEEKTNTGEVFAKKFATLFDFYVNETFAMLHRNETSLTEIPKNLNSYAGFNLEKEIEILSQVLVNPTKPLTIVIGGEKVQSKLSVIKNLVQVADKILVGGRLVLDNKVKQLGPHENIVLANLNEDTFDITDESIDEFTKHINESKTVVLVGPMGKFEEKAHEKGTKQIIWTAGNASSYKVVGGGDTVAAIKKFASITDFDFISTGGGAMLALLAGESLPALDSLRT